MFNYKNMTLIHLFQISVGIAMLISLYMLIDHLYTKSYHKMNPWRFPMLLAILLESLLI